MLADGTRLKSFEEGKWRGGWGEQLGRADPAPDAQLLNQTLGGFHFAEDTQQQQPFCCLSGALHAKAAQPLVQDRKVENEGDHEAPPDDGRVAIHRRIQRPHLENESQKQETEVCLTKLRSEEMEVQKPADQLEDPPEDERLKNTERDGADDHDRRWKLMGSEKTIKVEYGSDQRDHRADVPHDSPLPQ